MAYVVAEVRTVFLDDFLHDTDGARSEGRVADDFGLLRDHRRVRAEAFGELLGRELVHEPDRVVDFADLSPPAGSTSRKKTTTVKVKVGVFFEGRAEAPDGNVEGVAPAELARVRRLSVAGGRFVRVLPAGLPHLHAREGLSPECYFYSHRISTHEWKLTPRTSRTV